MEKRKLILWSAIILLIIALTVFSLYNRYSQKAFNPKKFLNEVKEENKPGLDSLQDAINYENYLNNRLYPHGFLTSIRQSTQYISF